MVVNDVKSRDLEIVSEAEQTWPLNHCLLFSLLMQVELMYHACSNLPCSRYTNAQVRSVARFACPLLACAWKFICVSTAWKVTA